MRTVWRLITHHIDAEGVLAWAARSRRLAIGWDAAGDLRQPGGPATADQIATVLEQSGDTNGGVGGGCLYEFRHRMRVGDLVILSTGTQGGRRLVMEVTGGYEWHPSAEPALQGGYQHQRPARLVDMDPDQLWALAGAAAVPGQVIRSWALIQCPEAVSDSDLTTVGVSERLAFV